jgi:hypothetical protein
MMSESGGTVEAWPFQLTEGDWVKITGTCDSSIPEVSCSGIGYAASNYGQAIEWKNWDNDSFRIDTAGDYYAMAAFKLADGREEKIWGRNFSVSPKPEV